MEYFKESPRPNYPSGHTGGDCSGVCLKRGCLKQLREAGGSHADGGDSESVYNSM